MRFLLNNKIVKTVAIHFVAIFLFHILTPTISLALTGGPSQLEYNGYSGVLGDNMVDPFTGDFSYGIPLLTIPGFQDGIPLGLNYNAGVTMEQEASWVGLGWNLNTGAISKGIRGLPDDYDGAVVTKRKYQKPNQTYVVGIGANSEIAGGLNLAKKAGLGMKLNYGANFRYNNYNGFAIGYTAGFGASLSVVSAAAYNYNKSLNLDSQQGAGLMSSNGLNIKGVFGFTEGRTMSSRNGIESISYRNGFRSFSESATNSFIPSTNFPRITSSSSARGKIGGTFFFNTADMDITVHTINSKFKNNVLQFPAYGYLNLENASGNNALMDFNRENDVLVSERSSVIANPVATYDLMNVSAPGLSDQLRPYRSDYGVFKDPFERSEVNNFGYGVDVDFGPGELKGGVNASTNVFGYSKSEPIASSELNGLDRFNFTTKEQTSINGFYQKAVLMSMGETTANTDLGYSLMDIESPIPIQPKIVNSAGIDHRMELNGQFISDETGAAPKAFEDYPETRSERYKRTTMYQYLKFEDVTSNTSVYGYDVGKQIHTIKALTPSGVTYEFAEPLFNMEQKEVLFSINHTYDSKDLSQIGKYTNYNTVEATSGNKSGIDNYYSSTELPPYAYAHLLSNIYSADYVDLDGNGIPSENDFGEYAHYEYPDLGASLYQWRVPYGQNQANFSIGSLATKGDDKASYTYGKKQINYVSTIETKTHIAKFVVSNRYDGLPVANEHGGTPTSSYVSQKKLDKIILYVKGENYASDDTDKKELKTVHFEYNYELCKGVPNNEQSVDNGKLTLKKVYFTYNGNSESITKKSPYLFDYHSDVSDENPVWNENYVNNWGDYQPYRFDEHTERIISNAPYPNQSDKLTYDQRKLMAGAWNLKEITTPSGGKIMVDYEQDDYQYVQDKKAMMMAEVVGTSTSASGSNGSWVNSIDLTHKYLVVKVPKDLTSVEAQECFDNLLDSRMYFKAYVRLKKKNGSPWYENGPGTTEFYVHDYIEGYAGVVSNSGSIFNTGGTNETYVSVKLKDVELSPQNGGLTNPIRKASLQYLRYSQPQLLASYINPSLSANGLVSIGNALIEPFSQINELFKGFYIGSVQRGYASELGANSKFPSFVKINAVKGVKYSGGHRVAKITVNDGWSDISGGLNSSSYVKEYIYRNTDQTSTGVASYEPLVFSEENPLRRPLYYGEKKMYYRDDHLFVEEPIGESFMPSARVGYSKVIIKNKSYSGVNIGTNGVLIKEFYTAKDFPVHTDRNEIKSANYLPPDVAIPFVGVRSKKHLGFSQGIYVETNNMHGAAKAETIKPYIALNKDDENNATNVGSFYDQLLELENSRPTSWVKYNYNTSQTNKLNSEVTVLEDGFKVTKELGKEVQFYSASRQYENEVNGVDVFVNVTAKFPPPSIVPIPMVSLMDQLETYREVSSTKVIHRKGILTEIEVFDGLSTVKTENLVFDGATGAVLLSEVNNEFGDPIYSYSIPGYAHYPNMAGAYKNIGFEVSGADYNLESLRNMPFAVGDKVEVIEAGVKNYYWIAAIDYDMINMTVVNSSGTSLTWQYTGSPTSPFDPAAKIRIVKSGNRNLLSVSGASVVSLKNPIDDVKFPFSLNGNGNTIGSFYNTSATDIMDVSNENGVPQCADIEYAPMTRIEVQGNDPYIMRFYRQQNGDILATVKFDKPVYGINIFNGTFDTNTDQYLRITTPSGTYKGTLVLSESAYGYCLNGVLNASATQFTDAPNYPNSIYNEVLKPYYNSTDLNTMRNNINNNPQRYGKEGVYRSLSSSVYRTSRNQEETSGTLNKTNVREDGTFKDFSFYSPVTNAVNKNWIEKSRVEKYSPYTGVVETSVPLRTGEKIYSSVVSGYKNQVPMWIGTNSKYFESAYNGWEEDVAPSTISGNTSLNGLLGTTSSSTSISVVNTHSHTGKNSIQLIPAQDVEIDFLASLTEMNLSNKWYIAEIWVKKSVDSYSENQKPLITVGTYSTFYDSEKSNIDGWQKMTLRFNPVSGNTLHIINTSVNNIYVDDIRIFPETAEVNCYVYNREYFRLKAELDGRNYARFYNYDDAGSLIQVKKETEKGIMTIQTQRSSANQHVTTP